MVLPATRSASLEAASVTGARAVGWDDNGLVLVNG
jgi:hypothetical protein